jgi:endonuclease YncB( thermonuclease family)
MIFDPAHRPGRGFGRRGAARRCRAGLVCLAFGLSHPCQAACGWPAGTAQVVAVDDRLEIVLADGRLVRLGGLDLPDAERAAPQTAKAAHDFLAGRLAGREAELTLLASETDRWGRAVGDLFVRDAPDGSPASIASAMLAAGFARVRPEFETRGCAAARLVLEDSARRMGLGVWRDPEYAAIPSFDASELRSRDGEFVVIEGTVRRVGFGRARIYLDLGPNYDGPTIVIPEKLEPALARAGHPVAGMVGRRIRARGALDDRFGPRIEIVEPEMLEILPRHGALGEAPPPP